MFLDGNINQPRLDEKENLISKKSDDTQKGSKSTRTKNDDSNTSNLYF